LRACPPGSTSRKRTCAPAGAEKVGVCGMSLTWSKSSEYEKSNPRVVVSEVLGEYPILNHRGSVR
jgi:hypothetical protein